MEARKLVDIEVTSSCIQIITNQLLLIKVIHLPKKKMLKCYKNRFLQIFAKTTLYPKVHSK